ncbi:octopamine receptor Oamb-like [Ctenocephalides felis]|uniref:octopamine receptor Oamb-like n=1 Tax=Ctenocephalides felis TaxID=7515 RepID=UPI000E6E409E|nr:octopamine receptor Oamb-like [Ctenocephalides felis]
MNASEYINTTTIRLSYGTSLSGSTITTGHGNSTTLYNHDGTECPQIENVDWLSPSSLASLTVLLTIDLLVILGNCLVIAAVFCSSKLRSVTNLFIVSLAVADLMVGIAVLPFSATWEVFKVWIFGSSWCRAWLALDVWMCTASILNLCAISLDRYVAVTRPVAYPSIMSTKRAKGLIAGLWVLSFVICFPPLVGWKDKKESEDLIDISSCPWTCELTNDAGYVVYSALGSFYIPMFVMLFFYWRIYRAAVRTTRAINQGFRTTKGSRGIGRFDEQRLTLRIHRGRGGSENRRCHHHSSIKSNASGRMSTSTSMRNCSPQHSSPRSASTSLGSTHESPEKSSISRTNTWVLHHATNNSNSGACNQVVIANNTSQSAPNNQLNSSAQPEVTVTKSSRRSSKSYKSFKKERVQISVQYPSAERLDELEGELEGDATNNMYTVHYSVSNGNSLSNHSLMPEQQIVYSSSQQQPIKQQQQLTVNQQLNSGSIYRPQDNHHLRVTSQRLAPSPTLSKGMHRRSSSCDSRDLAGFQLCESSSPSPTRRIMSGSLYRDDSELGSTSKLQQQNRKMGKRNIKAQVKRFRMETKAAKTLAIIVGGFIVCWFPFFTMYVIRAFCPDCIHPVLFSVLFWLGYCNSAINPLIYALFSKDFRYAFKRIICRYCFCCGNRTEAQHSGGAGGSRRGSDGSQMKTNFRFNTSFNTKNCVRQDSDNDVTR